MVTEIGTPRLDGQSLVKVGPRRSKNSWSIRAWLSRFPAAFRSASWLLPVLVLQIALSLRVNGPIATDEATYLVAGHQLLNQLFGHGQALEYGTYFSGVPGLYPVLAAAVDQVAGITGVRFVSLLCMLVVNLCLYLITVRFFGKTAGIFASIVFVTGSGASFLGWYATFDAPSLALLAVATLLAFGAGGRNSWRRLVVIGALLVLAVAMKYVALEYAAVVIAIVVLRVYRRGGLRRAMQHTGILLGSVAVCAAIGLLMVSPTDWQGFTATSSLDRRVLAQTARLDILSVSWDYIGWWLLLGFVGLLVALRQTRFKLEALGLFATGLLPIISQVVLGEATSLHKHTAFGFFFAAPLAGYAVASAFAFGRRMHHPVVPMQGSAAVPAQPVNHGRVRTLVGAIAPTVVIVWLLTMLGTGMASASTMQYGWPDEDQVVTALDPYVSASGNYLADNASIPAYLFRDNTQSTQWSAPWFFGYPDANHQVQYGDTAIAAAVQDHFFNAIVLRDNTLSATQLQTLMPTIQDRYRVAWSEPYSRTGSWTIWVPQE